MGKRVMIRISKYQPYGDYIKVTPKTWGRWYDDEDIKVKREYAGECVKLEQQGEEIICVALPAWLANRKGLLKRNDKGKFDYQVYGFLKGKKNKRKVG